MKKIGQMSWQGKVTRKSGKAEWKIVGHHMEVDQESGMRGLN